MSENHLTPLKANSRTETLLLICVWTIITQLAFCLLLVQLWLVSLLSKAWSSPGLRMAAF